MHVKYHCMNKIMKIHSLSTGLWVQQSHSSFYNILFQATNADAFTYSVFQKFFEWPQAFSDNNCLGKLSMQFLYTAHTFTTW